MSAGTQSPAEEDDMFTPRLFPKEDSGVVVPARLFNKDEGGVVVENPAAAGINPFLTLINLESAFAKRMNKVRKNNRLKDNLINY